MINYIFSTFYWLVFIFILVIVCRETDSFSIVGVLIFYEMQHCITLYHLKTIIYQKIKFRSDENEW